jgi:hypothetical protein
MASGPSDSWKPKFQDSGLEGLADMFRSEPEDPTPGAAFLDSNRLDFSVASLAVVDDHLEKMRGEELRGKARIKYVLRCGAYVGEVIRQKSPSPQEWHWLNYDDAVQIDSKLARQGKVLETIVALWDGNKGLCFPLAKVVKFLENGREDSVKFFAEVLIGSALFRKPE